MRSQLALAATALLAGCGDPLPSDEELDRMHAEIVETEGKRIRQEAVRDPSDDGFSPESEVDPNYVPPVDDENTSDEIAPADQFSSGD